MIGMMRRTSDTGPSSAPSLRRKSAVLHPLILTCPGPPRRRPFLTPAPTRWCSFRLRSPQEERQQFAPAVLSYLTKPLRLRTRRTLTQLPKHQRVGLPAVGNYQTARVNARLQLNVTDICLPVVGSDSALFFSTSTAPNHKDDQEAVRNGQPPKSNDQSQGRTFCARPLALSSRAVCSISSRSLTAHRNRCLHPR